MPSWPPSRPAWEQLSDGAAVVQLGVDEAFGHCEPVGVYVPDRAIQLEESVRMELESGDPPEALSATVEGVRFFHRPATIVVGR